MTNLGIITKRKMFGLIAKEEMLTMTDFSGSVTLKLASKFLSISVLNKIADTSSTMESLQVNIPLFAEVIAIASNAKEIEYTKNCIIQQWSLQQISEVAQSVFNAIDFQSAFSILGNLGKLVINAE